MAQVIKQSYERAVDFRDGHIAVKKSGGASNRGCPSGPGWMSINDVQSTMRFARL